MSQRPWRWCSSARAGEATYRFYVSGTADRLLSDSDIADPLPPAALAYHFGTLSLVTEPGANTLERLMRRAQASGKVIALDPNVRRAFYRTAPSTGPDSTSGSPMPTSSRSAPPTSGGSIPANDGRCGRPCARRRREKLVVVTDGATGAIATGAPGEITVPAPVVKVVDTIGAGDSSTPGS